MFFWTKQTVPDGMGFSTFGVTHLIWLLCLAIAGTITVLLYRKLDLKKRNTVRVVFGAAIVFLEIIKDIIEIFLGCFTAENLPLHLCGVNILLVCFDLFKPTKTVRHFLYYFSIPGASLALLFPNWTMLPCMNFSNIHSFVIHTMLVIYPIMLVYDGEISVGIKTQFKCIMLLVAMAIPIYFVNLALDTNFMFLMNPETGNPLGLFEKYLGSHLWGFPVLLPIVMFIMYIPISIISKCRKKI